MGQIEVHLLEEVGGLGEFAVHVLFAYHAPPEVAPHIGLYELLIHIKLMFGEVIRSSLEIEGMQYGIANGEHRTPS